eukprot:1136550-Pelagomonas_calceolata.AAC.1
MQTEGLLYLLLLKNKAPFASPKLPLHISAPAKLPPAGRHLLLQLSCPCRQAGTVQRTKQPNYLAEDLAVFEQARSWAP